MKENNEIDVFISIPNDEYEQCMLLKKILAGKVPSFNSFRQRLAYSQTNSLQSTTADNYLDIISDYITKAILCLAKEEDLESITLYNGSDCATGCGPIISFIHHGCNHTICYETFRDIEDTNPQKDIFEYCYSTSQGVWQEFVNSPLFVSNNVMELLCERLRNVFPSVVCTWCDQM